MNDFFQLLQKDREANAKILEKPSMGGVRDSVVEKYSEQAHFIYELLQNADDVKATKVSFYLEEEGLIFIHNGKKKFSVTDPQTESKDKEKGKLGHINAITSIGHSSKVEQQIGKFGVGFKAVFQYTNTPQIYEDEYKFEIRRFIVPYELANDHPKRPEGQTLFYFPFDNSAISKDKAYEEIEERLSKLQNPLLFIYHLEMIEWESIENAGSYEKDIFIKATKQGIKVAEVTTSKHFDAEIVLQQFLTFSQKINTSDLEISVAYVINNNQEFDYSRSYPAFCFFPTRERTNMKYIVQAPFLLIDNRQGIKRGNKWNKQLIKQLASITAESISIVKELGLLTTDFFNVLPLEKDSFDEEDKFYHPFFEQTLQTLRSDEAYLPTKEGGFATKSGAYLAANASILELFSSEQLSCLFKKAHSSWIFPSLIGTRRNRSILGDYLFEHLKIQELDITPIINQLHAVFLKEQSDEWLLSFYEYLADVSYVWRFLMEKPILRTEDDQQLSPRNKQGELQVFLPSDIQSEFPTVKTLFLTSEKCIRLFDGLSLRRPDLKAEIEISILPQYRDQDLPSQEKRLQHFEVFYEYYLKCPQNETFIFLDKIGKIPFIDCEQGGKVFTTSPRVVYFKTQLLESYFEGFGEVYWLKEDPYYRLFEKYGRDKITSFLKELGVHETPKLLVNTIRGSEIRQYNRQEGLKLPKVDRSEYLKDYQLEGLENILRQGDLEKGKTIWQLLSLGISHNRLTTYRLEYVYFYYNNKFEYRSPHYLRLLKSKVWISISERLSKPSEVTIELLESEGYEVNDFGGKELVRLLEIPKEQKDWERQFSSEELKEMYELTQKVKDYSEEDFEELEKIRKRRAIAKKQQTKPNSSQQRELVESTDLVSVLDKIAKFEKVVQSIESTNQIKEKAETFLTHVKKQVEDVQENTIKQRLLFYNLMSIQDFAAELAHVIKTSLYNVMNRAKFIKKEFPNPEFEDIFKIYANDIHHEMHNLEKAVDFILSYATIDENIERFDIKETIEHLFEYSIRDTLDKEEIHYEVFIPEQVEITYNKKAFEDIIENLITNSIKALENTDNKQIRCRGTIEQEQLILFFSDNGYGIEPDRQEKIFDIYETTTKEQGGSGIGLFTVKTRLQSLQGDIEVVENELKPTGATFKLWIPFKK